MCLYCKIRHVHQAVLNDDQFDTKHTFKLLSIVLGVSPRGFTLILLAVGRALFACSKQNHTTKLLSKMHKTDGTKYNRKNNSTAKTIDMPIYINSKCENCLFLFVCSLCFVPNSIFIKPRDTSSEFHRNRVWVSTTPSRL